MFRALSVLSLLSFIDGVDNNYCSDYWLLFIIVNYEALYNWYRYCGWKWVHDDCLSNPSIRSTQHNTGRWLMQILPWSHTQLRSGDLVIMVSKRDLNNQSFAKLTQSRRRPLPLPGPSPGLKRLNIQGTMTIMPNLRLTTVNKRQSALRHYAN